MDSAELDNAAPECRGGQWETIDNEYRNATLSRRHHRLVSDSDWHAVHFLTDITDIRDSVNSLQFSDESSLSSHDLNDILLHLATDRSDRS